MLSCYGVNKNYDENKKLLDPIIKRYVLPYSEIKEHLDDFDDNIKQLLKLITEEENNCRADLAELDFSGKYMPYWVFNNAKMVDCYMCNCCVTEASFRNCDLRGASFVGAIADQTDFSNTNLMRADFSSATLAAAVFSNAVCERTEFMFAEMEGAYFNDCKFYGSSFTSSCLVAANFDNAYFEDVDFSYADLTRADFANVTIEGGNWKNCLLEDTNLDGVKLMHFDLNNPEIIEMLSEARLENADWTGVTEEQRKMLAGQLRIR